MIPGGQHERKIVGEKKVCSCYDVNKLFSVATKNVTLHVGETFDLSASITPISAAKITYQSKNKKIARVSKSGVVTARKKGNTTVTVTSGKKTVKVKIRVLA